MQRIKDQFNWLGVSLLVMIIVLSFVMPVEAAGFQDLNPGTYEVQTNFTAFVGAMGGVEFGDKIADRTYVTIGEDRTAQITIGFKKGVVNIYGVTCDVFGDPNYPIQYLKDGVWTNVDKYTVSSNTALDPQNSSIHYLESVTFNLPSITDRYDFGLYINSNVMGVQFGSNSKYYSGFNIDWSTAQASEGYRQLN